MEIQGVLDMCRCPWGLFCLRLAHFAYFAFFKLPQELPIRVLAATAKDQYRKPGIGLYELLHDLYEAKGLEIGTCDPSPRQARIILRFTSEDIENSFYVGDAAGRAGDHNDTDRKFAVNAGLTFYTPEQYFKWDRFLLEQHRKSVKLSNVYRIAKEAARRTLRICRSKDSMQQLS
jgi:histidinol phosphatase-like enzyme